MKTVILCGGEGTRMREETEFKPKPLVPVGGMPILWHIMKIYAHHGYNDFVLALGYKGQMIKDYFLQQQTTINDFTLNSRTGEITFHNNGCDDFKITFAETGEKSLTGERLRRLERYIPDDEFMLTYGDGVADIDIAALVDFHRSQDTLCTITGVKPANRFGLLDIDHGSGKLSSFYQNKVTSEPSDKAAADFINGGFMVMKRDAIKHLAPDSMIETLFEPLSQEGELSVYRHPGTWKCMDTYKEVKDLNAMWEDKPFWKIWN